MFKNYVFDFYHIYYKKIIFLDINYLTGCDKMLLEDLLSFLRRRKIQRGDNMWPNDIVALREQLGIYDNTGPREAASILYDAIFDKEENRRSGMFATNLEEILDKLHIQAYYADMSEVFPDTLNARDNISACIINNNEERIIYINKCDGPRRQRFSVAHEIGHYILQHLEESGGEILYRNERATLGIDSREISANRFASSLLMPKYLVEIMYNRGFTVEMMADAFLVSNQVVTYRLQQLKLI